MNYNEVDLLLAEDNANDAELAIRELKKHNLANHLFHVKDGEEALHFIFGTGPFEAVRSAERAPKVILLDIQMPKVNGIEVLQRIRADERTRSIPVVMLTSSRQDPDIKRCYSLGANSYIVKPVNFEGFAESIKNLGFYWLLINEPPIPRK
ncbi:response regulator [Sediminibacterium roseum]|uniref:Response regulator n=1 Tax=Sediminibacterium roseum TaxID=1978412 RepID=A0ABW9ZTB1_9BACT|nr:response regulator [Sediminibacterium roseum]NCI49303.1 response regulator [Sediminibacterium roseum]